MGNIRNTNAIIHVLRCFDNGNITHVDGSIDPVRDKEIIDTELQLKDLETIDARLAKTQKQATSGGDKNAKRAVELLLQYKSVLEQGKSARTVELDKEDRKLVADLNLLTDKPVLYVCNVDEKSAVTGNHYTEAVKAAIAEENAEMLIIAAAAEAEIAELDEYEARQMFLEELGLKESGVARLIKSAYRLLSLQTFFTTGPDETRAWTFRMGMKAPQTAGIIHTDFERGFIRAEVIKYDDYVALGSERACRDVGKIGIEGKEYVVQDGDIMHFLFNV
jgi:GTP-binding protein YchF